MPVNKKVVAIVSVIVIALAVTLIVLLLTRGPKEDPNAVPEYYEEGPLRSYNYCGKRKVISLTFDDGPDIARTPNVLRDLRKAGIKATFFMSPAASGEPTAGQCALVERVLGDGHVIESHSWNHLLFSNMTNQDIIANLQRNKEWLGNCAGKYRSRLSLTQFRPPFGELAAGQPEFISNLGYTIAGWNIDSKDTTGGKEGGSHSKRGGTSRDVLQKIVADFRKVPHGSSATILMHDKHYDDEGTQGLIPTLVDYFEKQLGYSFVTAPGCFKNCNEYVTICEDDSVWPRFASL